jgi:hypothetical protein
MEKTKATMKFETTVTMYYDSYEYTNGDGVCAVEHNGKYLSGIFPQLEKQDFDSEIELTFGYFEESGYKFWFQQSGILIVKLDGDCGDKLLALLNEQHNVSATLIFNGVQNQLFPKYRGNRGSLLL